VRACVCVRVCVPKILLYDLIGQR